MVPTNSRPALKVNATVKPCVIAYGITRSPSCVFAAAKVVVAVAATVFNSAVSRDPPICWLVLTIALATPVS